MVVASTAARAMLRAGAVRRHVQQPALSIRSTLRQPGSFSQHRTLFTRKTPAQKFKNRAWTAAGLVLGGLLAVYAYDSSAGIHRWGGTLSAIYRRSPAERQSISHRWLAMPLLHAWTKDDPEESHKIAVKVLASGLSPVDIKADQEELLGFDVCLRFNSTARKTPFRILTCNV
jgi:hypothetical protein